MSENAQEPASLPRAVKRIDFAVCALAAAHDLHDVGATAAGGVMAEEADRLEGLADEVRELGKRREVA